MIHIYVGRNPVTRKRKYIGKSIVGGLRVAQAHLTHMLAERDLGRNVRSSKRPSRSTSITGSTSAPGRGCAPIVSSTTRVCFARYVRPRFGARPFGEVTPAEIQTLYSQLLNQNLSARTIRHTHAVLFSALRRAVRWKLPLSKPAEVVDLSRQPRRRFSVFDVEQAKQFIAAIADHIYGVLFALAMPTGTRPSEYLALSWWNFDLERETVSVSKTLEWQKEDGILKTKTGAQLADDQTSALGNGSAIGTEGNDLVFTAHRGGPIREAVCLTLLQAAASVSRPPNIQIFVCMICATRRLPSVWPLASR